MKPERPEYKELVVLSDPTLGLQAPITYREEEGRRRYSFMIVRGYIKPGDQGASKGTTPWLHKKHIAAARKLLDEVEMRLNEEEKNGRFVG